MSDQKYFAEFLGARLVFERVVGRQMSAELRLKLQRRKEGGKEEKEKGAKAESKGRPGMAFVFDLLSVEVGNRRRSCYNVVHDDDSDDINDDDDDSDS